MRVLHVFGTMGLGGAERRTVALLPHLDMASHPQHFATLTGQPGSLDPVIAAAGGTVHPCAIGPGFPLRFARLVRQVRPDVLHSHVHWASGPLVAMAHALGVPGRIVHFRASGDLLPPSRRRALRDLAFRRLARRHATRVLSVSAGALDATWGPAWRTEPRCSVVYSGVQTERFAAPPDRAGVRAELGLAPDSRIAIHVGNIAPAKNHARLGDLFAALARQHPDLWLVAVGLTKDPSCERALLDNLHAGGARDRVVLTGVREDVPRLLAASDLFLFPSVTEGLPGAVVEARAAGLPVVASDLPGTLEIAAHLDRIDCLSLQRPDTAWLAAMEAALSEGTDPHEPGHSALDGSPFTAQASARAHEAAWAAAVHGPG